MPPFVQYLALVIVILALATIYVIAFGMVANEISKLRTLVRGKRKDRKIFKTAERCRDDFA
jgi:hypothetical protein